MQGIDLAIMPGEMLAIEGASGAGKKSRKLLKTLRDGTTLTDSLTTKDPLFRGGKPLDIPGTRTSPANINLTFP